MDNIACGGTCEIVAEGIASALKISLEDAEKVFCFLENTYQDNSTEFGCLCCQTGQELVFGGEQYYINIPKSIVAIIALLLDINLTKGVVSGVCAMLGISTQVFYRINQHNGESCLLRESMRGKGGIAVLLQPSAKECINNDLICKYRSEEGSCGIQKAEIERILTYFRDIKIVD